MDKRRWGSIEGKVIGRLLLFVLLFFTSCTQVCFANFPDGWNLRHPPSFKGIAYGGNTFVLTGTNFGTQLGIYGIGDIITTSDLSEWTVNSAAFNYPFYAVAYGNSTFVAVGSNGKIRTSSDGTTWTSRTSGTTYTLNAVTYSDNLFVAVGANGTIRTSPDGTTWTGRSSGTANALNGVARDNNSFVAVGASGTILASTDGTTWTSRTSGTTNNLYGVTARGTGWLGVVAVGANGTILVSTDGNAYTWTRMSSGTTNALYGVAEAPNGNFCSYAAVGDGGVILTCPSWDGTPWTVRSSGTTERLNAVAYGNSTFVAVGNYATIRYAQGDQLITWNSSTLPALTGVASGNNTYVAVGLKNVLTSTDGTGWISQIPPPSTGGLQSVTYGNGSYVSFDSSGTIFTSSNGIAWTSISSGTSNCLNGATYGNSTYVVVGNNGAIVTSSNGTTWTLRSSGTANNLFGVTYGDNTFVAVGANGTILTSTSGTTWTSKISGTTFTLYGIAYGNGTFLAVGANGKMFKSSDGTTWNPIASSGTSSNLYNIAYANGTFVAVSASGEILSSFDCTNWTSWSSGTTDILLGVTYGIDSVGNNTFIAVGDNLTICQSSVMGYPIISVPTSVDFGSVNVGSSSSPQTVTVTNNGTGSLSVQTITVTGTNASDFSIQNDSVSGTEIGAGGNSTLEVVFSPGSSGSLNATLLIPSSDASSPTSISLMGTGVEVNPVPAAPSNLSTSAISSSQIDLTWTDNSNNEQGFKIERKTGDAGTYSQIDTVGVNVTSYSNSGLSSNTKYWYRVKAYNGSGDSPYSNENWSTTNASPSLPSKPVSPDPSTGATGQLTSLILNWQNGGGATSYNVYFGTSSSSPASQGNQSGNTFTLSSLNYSTTYYWRIDAVNSTGTTTGDVWSFTTEDAPVPPSDGGGGGGGGGVVGPLAAGISALLNCLKRKRQK